jgi:hypothetical protein
MRRRRRRYGMVCVLSLLLLPAAGLAARDASQTASDFHPGARSTTGGLEWLDPLFRDWLGELTSVLLGDSGEAAIPPPNEGENGGSCIDPNGCKP